MAEPDFCNGFSVAAATAAIAVEPVESYAYTETAGVLNDGPVQMRKSPVNGEKSHLWRLEQPSA